MCTSNLATIERVAAIARAHRWKCAGHRFLDAAASNEFAFDDYTFQLLGERILPTHLSAARLLPGLVWSACACFGCGPIALDDDDRAAVLGRCCGHRTRVAAAMPTLRPRAASTISNAGVPLVAVVFPIAAFATSDVRKAFDQLDPHHILGVLVAELPLDAQANRCTVGNRQILAVQPVRESNVCGCIASSMSMLS